MKYCLYIMLCVVLLCCCKNSNSIKSHAAINTIDTLAIDTSEFILFWDKFSDALLANDTSALSRFIDDEFYGYCSPKIDNSKICKMNFKKDSIISKNRFLKEFKPSLNPIYLQLLRQYEIRKDIQPVRTLEAALNRYVCKKQSEKGNYSISTYLARENKNDTIIFTLRYYNENEKVIDLIFRNVNGKIKLCEMQFYYLYVFT